MTEFVPHIIYLFARGGGGGSGGGGGGGDSGILLAGYLPMHALGAWFRRKDKLAFGQLITWPVSVLYAGVLILVFHDIGVLMALGAPLGAAAGLYGWWGKIKRNKRAKQALKAAATNDSSWDEAGLKDYVSKTFVRFQYDWSKGDTEPMKSYLAPEYHYHISLMIAALKQASRVNQVNNPKITNMEIQSVVDATENSQDRFVMGIEAVANDQLIDARDSKVIFQDNNTFTEYWHFVKNGSTWQLEAIRQITENTFSASTTIENFAKQNNLCYSLDWGWLLLPQRGQIFSSGKFGTADINNHCIGVYNDMLIQIYSYLPNPQQNIKQLLVAQAQLPKSYGDIVVRRKKNFSWSRIKNLQKIEMEWGDFNKKYEVFASTAEGPTSFELLHPVFMEVLERQPFEINLEVVDDVVYFYANEKALTAEHYPIMLVVLQEAFKQMKM